MSTIVPPREVFKYPIKQDASAPATGGYDIPGFIDVIQGEGGEMLARYALLETPETVVLHPQPRKGLPYKEAVKANNNVKRITLLLFVPFAGLKKGLVSFFDSYLENYSRLALSLYSECKRNPILEQQYFNTTSKGLWKLAEVFLQELGFRQETARSTGEIVATFLEYDDAYRLPIVDAMSCFTKEEILKSPRKFINKFLKIIGERSEFGSIFNDKYISFGRIIKFLLFIPKVKRAFKKAFEQVDLKLLQYDNIDYYWSLNKDGYRFHGRTIDDRFQEYSARIADHLNKATGKEVQVIDNGDYTCEFRVLDKDISENSNLAD